MAAVMTMAARTRPVNSVETVFFSFSRLPLPIYCAISTVPPVHRPMIRLVRIKVTWPPMLTPAILAVPLNVPTTHMSATLYRDCMMLDSKKGVAKRISPLSTLPSERLFSNRFIGTSFYQKCVMPLLFGITHCSRILDLLQKKRHGVGSCYSFTVALRIKKKLKVPVTAVQRMLNSTAL